MPIRRIVLLSYLLTAVCLTGLALNSTIGESSHGLRRTKYGLAAPAAEDQWPWPYVDGADFSYSDLRAGVGRVVLRGTVWQDTPDVTVWRVIHTGDILIRVDGRVALEVPERVPLRTDTVVIHPDRRAIPIEIEADYGPAVFDHSQPRFEVGIYEQTWWGGWRLLPSYRLYPDMPDAQSASAAVIRATITTLLWVGVFVGTAGAGAAHAVRLRLWRQQITWLTLAIITIAIIVRYLHLFGLVRVGSPFIFYIPPGADNYVLAARALIAGTSNPGMAYYQPGTSIWFAGITHLFGPRLITLYAFTLLAGGLSAGAVTLAGKLAYGDRAGVIAGLIAAIAAPLVAGQADLQVDGLSASATAWVVLAGSVLARRCNWKSAALYGGATGIAALIRPTLLVFLPAVLPATVLTQPVGGWRRGLRRSVLIATIAAIAALLTISPQSVANRLAGNRSLISSNGPINLYIGNNRDASGAIEFDRPAYLLASARADDWVQATVADVRADPLRFAALYLHKLGLFWSGQDFIDFDSYVTPFAVRFSSLTDYLPFNGWWGITIFIALASAGLAMSVRATATKSAGFSWLVIIMVSAITLVTSLFVVAARLRMPALLVLCFPAGLMVDRLVSSIRLRKVERGLIGSVIVGLVLVTLLKYFEYGLPIQRFFCCQPPPTAIARADNFDGRIRLVAMEPLLSNHQSEGYVFVTLYWAAADTIHEDYLVSLQLLDHNAERVSAVDRSLGSNAYPEITTSHWPADRILRESYFIPLPADPPAVLRLYVLVGDPAHGPLRLIGPNGTSTSDDRVHLGTVGILTADYPPPLTGEVVNVNYRLGDDLEIIGMSLPHQLDQADDLTVGLRFEANSPILEDYIIFFHVFDSHRNLVAQSDSPILTGDWTTGALIPGYPLDAEREINLPDALPPGVYSVIMGAYRYPSLERLAAWDGDVSLLDGLIELGTVEVSSDSP